MSNTPTNKQHSKGEADLSLALREAMALQEIEGNPLDAEQVAMFAMFEREGWTHERRLAFIQERAHRSAVTHAAE